MSANAEMLCLYWDIGRMVAVKQDTEGWGAAVIPRLSLDLRSDLPEIKGFSERNIGRMITFFRTYPDMDKILPQSVAKLNQKPKQVVTDLPQTVAKTRHTVAMECLLLLVPKIPWGHNILLMEKVKSLSARLWYSFDVSCQGSVPESISDPRPESYNIAPDSIELGNIIKAGKTWEERCAWLLNENSTIKHPG